LPLTCALAAAAPSRRPASATPSASATADGHVELLTVCHHSRPQRRADFRAPCTDPENAGTGMMNDLDFDTISRHSELVERHLNRFVDCDSLCFDARRHDGLLVL